MSFLAWNVIYPPLVHLSCFLVLSGLIRQHLYNTLLGNDKGIFLLSFLSKSLKSSFWLKYNCASYPFVCYYLFFKTNAKGFHHLCQDIPLPLNVLFATNTVGTKDFVLSYYRAAPFLTIIQFQTITPSTVGCQICYLCVFVLQSVNQLSS